MKLKTKIGDKSLELIKKYAAAHQLAHRLPVVDIADYTDKQIIEYCQKYANAVDAIITPTAVVGGFTMDQRDALISFASDCGISALRKVCTLPVDEIGEEMLKYNVINGEVVDSMTQRRAEEYTLFTGEEAPTEDTTDEGGTSDPEESSGDGGTDNEGSNESDPVD